MQLQSQPAFATTRNTIDSACQALGLTDARRLASIDLGLFRSLSRLGTSRARISAVLGITDADFDYLEALVGER